MEPLTVYFQQHHCHLAVLSTNKDIPFLASEKYFFAVSDSISTANSKYKCKVWAYCLLPEQVYLLVMFEQRSKITEYIEGIKTASKASIVKLLEGEGRKDILNEIRFAQKDKGYKVWATSVESTLLSSVDSVQEALDLVHIKPVRRGLVTYPETYPHSSARYFLFGDMLPVKVSDFKKDMGLIDQ